MDAKLHNYSKRNPPNFILTKAIMHPRKQAVIGHIGFDKSRDIPVAAFPRREDEHKFQGLSTSGLTGYGVSEDVLSRFDSKSDKPVELVVIVETDGGRVIEYDRADFEDATVVAYAPSENKSVIGDDTMRVDDEVYNDRQRVVPVAKARRVLDRTDVTITK